MAVGDRVENFPVDEVSNLQFGGGQRLPDNDRDRRDSGDRRDDRDRRESGDRPPEIPPPPPPAAEPSGMQLQAGTPITVRMIDAVDSEQTHLGQTYRASVDEPVLVDGQPVIQRGADAVVKLVEDQQSGKIAGRTVLGLALIQVTVNGRMIDVTSGDVSQASSSRGARSGKVIGGTAAVGAILGGIVGGGRGAAIGAGSGAAVGTGAEVLTKGQRVRIPSETRLTFTLQQPAQI
jgi:hypothetical protein